MLVRLALNQDQWQLLEEITRELAKKGHEEFEQANSLHRLAEDMGNVLINHSDTKAQADEIRRNLVELNEKRAEFKQKIADIQVIYDEVRVQNRINGVPEPVEEEEDEPTNEKSDEEIPASLHEIFTDLFGKDMADRARVRVAELKFERKSDKRDWNA